MCCQLTIPFMKATTMRIAICLVAIFGTNKTTYLNKPTGANSSAIIPNCVTHDKRGKKYNEINKPVCVCVRV